MNIVGQENILEEINNTPHDKFPSTLCIVGSEGSGKHSVCEYISEYIGLPCNYLEEINLDIIQDIMMLESPYIYVIDRNTKVKDESVILKFLEEPPVKAIIVLLPDRDDLYSDIILSRCFTIRLNTYSKDTLKMFTDNELLVELFDTPGQILENKEAPIEEYSNLCSSLLAKVSCASFSSILSALDKIEDNHILLISKLFEYYASLMYARGDILYNIVSFTEEFCNDCLVKNLNKRYLLEEYACNLKLACG